MGGSEVTVANVLGSPRVNIREGSVRTDVSSDLGDLRIQTNYDDNRISARRMFESSPESSSGVDLLSPYLDHSNKLPRFRKYYAHR